VVVVRRTVVDVVVGFGAAVVGVAEGVGVVGAGAAGGVEVGDGAEVRLGAAVVGVTRGAALEPGRGAVVDGDLAGVAASVVGTGMGAEAAAGRVVGTVGAGMITSTSVDVADPSAPTELEPFSSGCSEAIAAMRAFAGCLGGAVLSIHAARAAAVVVDRPMETRRARPAGNRRLRRGEGEGELVGCMPKGADRAAVPSPVGRATQPFTRSVRRRLR
jgi:hypothetical protein